MKDTELDVNNNSKPRSNKPLSAKDFVKVLFPNITDEELDSLAAEIEQNHNDLQVVTDDEKRFREILESVGREGTQEFLDYLKKNNFFTIPASVNHHSNWKGGLVQHSLKVYDCALRLRKKMLEKDPSLEEYLPMESIAVAALLHDICKTDEYRIKADGTPAHKIPSANLGGHGEKSVILILFNGYKLEGDEILAIRWHMGSKHISNSKERKDCEKAKRESYLCRLIIRADYQAAKSAGTINH